MEITLTRENDAVHFVANDDAGHTVHIDGSEKLGGVGAGFRPMQLLLASLGGCSSMDVVSILAKQRQGLRDVRVRVSGTRSDGTPSPFTSVHLHFDLTGTVERGKAEQAVALAVDKYCSVAATFSPTVNVTHSVSIDPGSGG